MVVTILVVLAACLLENASAFTSVPMPNVMNMMSGGSWSAKWAPYVFGLTPQKLDHNRCLRSHLHVKSRKSSLVMFTELPVNGKVDEADLIKVFGRLAETKLFGNAGAGHCCHGGCFDCQWRDAFEILQSSKPTWIPTYRYHCLDHLCYRIYSGPDQHSMTTKRGAVCSSSMMGGSTSRSGLGSSPETPRSGRRSSKRGCPHCRLICPPGRRKP